VTALFETMLAVGGFIVQLDEHVQRMARSCRELNWEPLDEDAFRNAAHKAVRTDESAVRVVNARGMIETTAFAIPDATRSRRAYGRAILLDPAVTRSLPHHKLLPRTVCSDSLRDAIQAGADEALFVTPDGRILEGTSTNVFAFRGDVLITAPAEVLPGIVRAWVLATVPDLGLRIEERAPTADDIRNGGFFTGSLTKLAPIRTLDGHLCAPPGDAYSELARLYTTKCSGGE
jgi:branched-subunit amino acid aminotransferase/4-amino-4-deoxychorismate lyase